MIPQSYFQHKQQQQQQALQQQQQLASEHCSVTGHRTNPCYQNKDYYVGSAGDCNSVTGLEPERGPPGVTCKELQIQQRTADDSNTDCLAALGAPACGYFPGRSYVHPSLTHQQQSQYQSSEQLHQNQLQQQQQQQKQQQQQQLWYPNNNCRIPSAQSSFPLQAPSGTWMANASDSRITGPATNKFPDSPPDSGSEPHSPPNPSRSHTEGVNCSFKLNPGSSMTALIPSQPFMNPHARPGGHGHPISGSASFGSNYSHYLQNPQQQQHHPSASMFHHHNMPFAFSKSHFGLYGPMEISKLNEGSNHEEMMPAFSSIHGVANQPPKKRKYSDSPPGTLATVGLMHSLGGNILPVKPEPCQTDLHFGIPPDCSEDESYGYENYPSDAYGLLDGGPYKVITWTNHLQNKWASLMDDKGHEISSLLYRVDADKGFNFAASDESFVCQKKNHFQITVHINLPTRPKYVRSLDNESVLETIDAFKLHFYGIKAESPAQTIKIEQSQSDRSKKVFNPVDIRDLFTLEMVKHTVGRLHFSETTLNNMRKKGKPNPDQRYFQLVVALEAYTGSNVHMIAAHVSDKIIVRASNPGQFENDVEVIWNKGKNQDAIYHVGRVGINTESPDEALTVHGNVRITGHVISPSDARVKKDLEELDTSEQLRNISQLRVYNYTFNEDFAEYAGLSDEEKIGTGVLAQELSNVLPDAVRETGDIRLPNGQMIDKFLVVNKERIFIENVGAVKELCKVTDKLENRISEMEIINKKLSKYSKCKRDSFLSSSSSSCVSSSANSSVSQPERKSQSNSTSVSRCHHQRHHHRHHHSSCGGQDPPTPIEQNNQSWCNNSIIQLIVIVLVVIMAVCLLSITTLYVIDRKNIQDQSSAVQQVAITPGPQFANGSTQTTRIPGHLLPPHCLKQPQDCPRVCCGYITEPSSEPRPDDPDHPVFSTMATKKWWDKSTRPPNDANDVPDHPVFSTTSTKKRVWYKSTRSPNEVPDYLEENDYPEIEMLPEISFPPISKPSKTTSKTSDADRIINNTKYGKKTKSETGKQKRDTNIDKQLVLVSFKQLNESVSDTYCVTTDCLQQRGSNFTYSIPMSANFPRLFVTLQFMPSANSPDVNVMLCNQSQQSFCSLTTSDDKSLYVTSKIDTFEWDLPAGYFLDSHFTFRVTPTLQSTNVCELPNSNIGYDFSEYNFHFYRVCF